MTRNLPLINPYSIFGKYANVNPGGLNSFVNKNNDTVKIETLAELGDTWILFSSTPDSLFMATVTDISLASVLGNMQQIKEIRIELRSASYQLLAHPFNGKKIRISENLGFVTNYNFLTFPLDTSSYNLCGTGSGLGKHALPESEIYDFEIGDVFHYQTKISNHADWFQSYSSANTKLKILSKATTSNSVSYTAERFMVTVYEDNDGPSGIVVEYSTIHDTISLDYSFTPFIYPTYINEDDQTVADRRDDYYNLIAQWMKGKGKVQEWTIIENYDYRIYVYDHLHELVYSNTVTGEFGDSAFLDPSYPSYITNLNLGDSVLFGYIDIPNASYFWDFGDGETSTQKSPAHKYNISGDYRVELTISIPSIGTYTVYKIITVGPTNLAPSAVNDVTSTLQEVPVNINVLANDFDSDGLDTNSLDLNTSFPGIQHNFTSSEGSWTIAAPGVVNFVPGKSFVGNAYLTYTISDNRAKRSNSRLIKIVVSANPNAPSLINDTPIAYNDSTALPYNTSVRLYITGNDIDDDNLIDGASLDLDVNTPGIQTSFASAEGNFSSLNNGFISFTPVSGFVGTANIDYFVSDNKGFISNQAHIRIEVLNMIPPLANDDVFLAQEDQILSFMLSVNDSDIDGTLDLSSIDLDPVSNGIQSSISVFGGTLTASSSGIIDFTPAPNYFGTFYHYYRISDNMGNQSGLANIQIQVSLVNDAPVAFNDSHSDNEDNAVFLILLSNDFDVDGYINAASIDLDPSQSGIQQSITTPEGSWQVDASGIVTFTPILNFNGIAIINYTVSDNEGALSNTATISITVTVNDAPVATNDNLTGNEDEIISLNLANNDSDIDGAIDVTSIDLDPNTLGLQQSVTNVEGNWSVDLVGLLTFIPALNFNGTATLSYVIQDDLGAISSVATVTITINSINDAPVAESDSITMNQNESITIPILSNDTDIDGILNLTTIDLDTLTTGLQQNVNTAEGNWSASTSGTLTFTPDPSYFGVAEINYVITDDLGLPSNSALVNLLVIPNLQGLLLNDTLTILQGQTTLIDVLANDSDSDGSFDFNTLDLSAEIGIQTTLNTSSGTWSTDGSGMVQFTPLPAFIGTTSIHYRIADNDGFVAADAKITVFVQADSVSKVIESEMEKVFVMYPNPVSAVLNIKAENLRQIKIYSAIGQLVYESEATNPIELTGWSAGLYIVEARFENEKVIREEFIKE